MSGGIFNSDQLRNTQNADVPSYLYVVQEPEVAGSAGSLIHSLGQLQGTSPALRPVVTWHSVRRAALFCYLTHKVNLCLGVSPKGSPRETLLAVLGGHGDKCRI